MRHTLVNKTLKIHSFQRLLSYIHVISTIFLFLLKKIPKFEAKLRDMKYLIGGCMVCMVCMLIACQPARVKEIDFYHWEGNVKIDAASMQYLNDLQAKRLYIRFFDVDKDPISSQAVPIGVAKWASLPDKEIIPCVFITQNALQGITENDARTLGHNIAQKIFSMADSLKTQKIKEIQTDCDWTEKTKAAYFTLMLGVREKWAVLTHEKLRLTATIRLHQVKYANITGVPPADAGVLMYYNMSDVRNLQTHNSILNNAVGKQYLSNFEKYPLHLDLALPVFSWGSVFRYGKLVMLLNDFALTDSTQSFFKQEKENQFVVTHNHYHRGKFLYENDQIRIESPTKEALIQAAHLLSPHLPKDSLRVIFYQLSTSNQQRFPVADLRETVENL